MLSFLRQFHDANRKVLIPFMICMGFAVILTVSYQSLFGTAIRSLDISQQNQNVQYGRAAKKDPRLFFLAIDYTTYYDRIGEDEAVGSPILTALRTDFPWSRSVWAAVIERLMKARARLVIFDLILSSPGKDAEGDKELREVLDKYKDRVIIGCNFQKAQGNTSQQYASLVMPSKVLFGNGEDTVANTVPQTDSRIGYVSMWPDDDEVIRSLRLSTTLQWTSGVPSSGLPNDNPDTVYSLEGRALQKLGLKDYMPNSWDPLIFRYVGAPFEGFNPNPLYEIFIPNTWKSNYKSGEALRDKIVLVGPAADVFHDMHRTPYGEMLGPEIHLNMLNAVLKRDFLKEVSASTLNLFLLFGGLLAFLESYYIKSPFGRGAAGLGTVFFFLLISWIAYNYLALYLPTASSALVFSGGMVFTIVYQFIQEQYERSRLRGVLDRYMSKDLVKDVLENPNSYFNTAGGVRKPVAVLFSDVRGFTTISEGADPGELVKQLNEYLGEMVKIVFQNKGTLDKFIGDAVMAVWGNVVSGGPDVDASRAVHAALEMRAGLKKLNADWKQRAITELSFGIGINHGEVIVGNIGSDQKMEITVIGDVVNLASRLESLTKEYSLDLLIGEQTAELVSKEFYLQMVDNVQVKGKFKPVRVYAVLGLKGEAPDVELEKYLEQYNEAMELYRKGEFSRALTRFQQVHAIMKPNELTRIYQERCHNLITIPPVDWDGVYKMTKK